MPALTPGQVRRQIQSASVDPVYLLQGDDEVEKSALAHEFEEIVEEDLRAFNVERMYAGDLTSGEKVATGVAALVGAVRTLPMMVPRRVVLVFQAEALLTPKRESEAASRALDTLEALVRDPVAEATLVLVATSVDRRSRMYRLLAKHATTVECGAVETEDDAERWVRNRIAAAGAVVDAAGARLIAERAGPDITRLRNDVERLLLYATGRNRISVDDVRMLVGPAALKDDWALANAVADGDAAVGLQQVALLLEAGAPPEQILGQLGWLVRTKFPAAAGLEGAVDAVFQTDLALKRSLGDARVLLERLVVDLSARVRRRTDGPRRAS